MSHKYQPIICYYNHFAVAVNFLLVVQIKDVKSNKYQVKVKVNIHSKAKANIHSKVKVSRDRMFKGSNNNRVNTHSSTHKMHSNNSTTSRVSTNRMGNSSSKNNSKRGQHPSKVSITNPALHLHRTGIHTVKTTTTRLLPRVHSQINHPVAGNQGNIHPVFTTRAPKAAPAAEGYQLQNEGYQQQNGGYQQQNGGYQENGGYQQQNGGYQERNGYQQQKTVRPWAYTGSHIQQTGSRQDHNQAYAPQGQSNVGQGQVAGEDQSFGLERRRGEAPAHQGQGKNNNMAAKNDCEMNSILWW